MNNADMIVEDQIAFLQRWQLNETVTRVVLNLYFCDKPALTATARFCERSPTLFPAITDLGFNIMFAPKQLLGNLLSTVLSSIPATIQHCHIHSPLCLGIEQHTQIHNLQLRVLDLDIYRLCKFISKSGIDVCTRNPSYIAQVFRSGFHGIACGGAKKGANNSVVAEAKVIFSGALTDIRLSISWRNEKVDLLKFPDTLVLLDASLRGVRFFDTAFIQFLQKLPENLQELRLSVSQDNRSYGRSLLHVPAEMVKHFPAHLHTLWCDVCGDGDVPVLPHVKRVRMTFGLVERKIVSVMFPNLERLELVVDKVFDQEIDFLYDLVKLKEIVIVRNLSNHPWCLKALLLAYFLKTEKAFRDVQIKMKARYLPRFEL
eukprot:TRINITY_DN1828_c0_g2_i1.p1 TRINITY_DN1828_c0_g2~~TRINITY_DN1828_c0_g2_i1.p1  ORF type:complete len:396 (+),score=34.16 TRINITY_DN1828_c0_g2_i1:71-1189(+)